MSDSARPHRWQPTRLPRPWDSPGQNTGVGCHFLLQCMKVKSESEAAQSCPTLSDPMDCSPPGSPVPGILQARVLSMLFSHFTPPPSPTVSSSLFPMSVSPLLPCKWVHQPHLSRLHTYALIFVFLLFKKHQGHILTFRV